MHATNGSVDELDVELPEIMLTEFPWQSFKTNQGLHRLRAQRSDQAVQSRFAASIARNANAPENFPRWQIVFFVQDIEYEFPEILDDTGSSDVPQCALR